MMIPDGNNDCNELDDIDRIEKLLEKWKTQINQYMLDILFYHKKIRHRSLTGY